MKIYFRMKALLGLLLFSSAGFGAAKPEIFDDIQQIESDLSSLTGLSFKHHVPYTVISRDELRSFLDERMKDSMKPEDMRAEELTLKMLGLLPPNFDLRKSTVDLLTEQAAAFYDYHKKKLFILENETGVEARMALVHELAHALADQNFHLNHYVQDEARSDDAETARLAVMEGQASWLMTAYLSKQGGGPSDVPEPILKLMQSSMETGAEEYPVFSKSPLYIRESLVFPYAQGIAFQDAVYRRIGREAFMEVFRRAPLSTQQVIHPERYLAEEKPELPELPQLPTTKGFRVLASGTLGEMDYRTLLTQYAEKPAAEKTAAHLNGSVYELIENKREKYPVLALASIWESADSAREYLRMYRRVMEQKWKKLEVEREDENGLMGRGDSGYFRLSVTGRTVTTIEGWQSPLH